MPKLEVLDLATLSPPASRAPPVHPLCHPLHEVLRVRREHDAKPRSLARDRVERLDHASQRHPVIRRRRLRNPVIETSQTLRRRVPVLDYTGSATRVAPLATVSQARLVGEDRDQRPLGVTSVTHATISIVSISSRKSVKESPVGRRASIASRPPRRCSSTGMTTYSTPRRQTMIR